MFWTTILLFLLALVAISIYAVRLTLTSSEASGQGNFTLGLLSWGGFLINIFTPAPKIQLSESSLQKIQGKRVLITGCSRGLGRSLAVRLTALGLRVTMGCRRELKETEEYVLTNATDLNLKEKRSGIKIHSPEAINLDVADLSSIDSAIQELKKTNTIFNYFVTNAAIVPLNSTRDKYQLETAVTTNYLGHFYLTNRLLEEKLLPLYDGKALEDSSVVAKVVIISSESHRISCPYEQRKVGDYVNYTVSTSLQTYAYTKWLVLSFAFELARRINKESLRLKISSICPGAVNTNIAHHAPEWLLYILKPIFAVTFKDPLTAALPIVRLLLDEVSQPATDILPSSPFSNDANYYLMWQKKLPKADILNEKVRKEVWEESERVIEKIKPK